MILLNTSKTCMNLKNNTINGQHSYLLEYYNKARLGKIKFDNDESNIVELIDNNEIVVIGHELMQQLNNLIDDLETGEFVYDMRDSEFRIGFIERFCKHTKSPFYGKAFKLDLWEKALIEAFYSFKWSDTLQRRFKKCILLVARKNGKSTLCAALALTELMVNIGGVDIVISSNDDPQADIIFQEVNNMREQFDPKSKRTHKNLRGIYNLLNKSTVKKLSDRTKNKEGYNIDYAYIDEVHEMIANTIAKPVEQSQSTKDEPGLFEITTEGFVVDGFLDSETSYARKVLDGEIEDKTLLVWFYTQDSEQEIWQNPISHYKSNPSLGIVKKSHYLKDQLKKAKLSKADRVYTLAKDFNIKQNSAAAWLMEEDYTNLEEFELEDMRGAIAIAGVDLAETTDLASLKVIIMRPGSKKKYMISKYFIPSSKIAKGTEDDKKDYQEWVDQGLIVVSPGNENDFSLITKYCLELYKIWGIYIFKVGYDNALAKYWVNEMEEAGFELEKVLQNYDNMSEPLKLVEDDLKANLVIYNNNPIDRWCYANSAIKVNDRGQIMLVKIAQTQRIDGSVAHGIVNAIYIRHRTEYLNLVR